MIGKIVNSRYRIDKKIGRGGFGIVFGSRAVRFFIAWTFITVLPFAGQDPTGQWLNLKHLYLVSLGFCVILAAGTTGCSELLARHRWRRYAPYAVPLAFVIAAVVLTHKLDHQNRQQANSPTILSLRARLVAAVADRSSSTDMSSAKSGAGPSMRATNATARLAWLSESSACRKSSASASPGKAKPAKSWASSKRPASARNSPPCCAIAGSS